jgi:hypothetical protein
MSRVPYLGAALTAAGGIDALVESDEGTASEFLDPIAAMQGTQGGYERNKKENIYDQMAKDVKAENAPKPEPSVTANKISRDFDTTSEEIPPAPAAVSAAPVVAPKTAFEMFMEQNDLDRAALEKQRKDDQNMALLAAGLGMLGGESPYAFSNIGKGGLSGVSYLSDANKQRAAEKAALDKNRVAAMHYANVGKYYDSQTLSKEERADLQRQKLLEDKVKSARDDYLQYERMVIEGFNKQYPMAALTPDDPKTIKLKQEWMAKHAPVLESLRMSGYPNLPAIGGSSTGTGSLADQAAKEKARREANK